MFLQMTQWALFRFADARQPPPNRQPTRSTCSPPILMQPPPCANSTSTRSNGSKSFSAPDLRQSLYWAGRKIVNPAHAVASAVFPRGRTSDATRHGATIAGARYPASYSKLRAPKEVRTRANSRTRLRCWSRLAERLGETSRYQ
ncbi:hypothetical protein FRC12_011293 [Ceratobasidium sp. 428]|nr:hypothetical protein FRC12_011293 [Ceratobasidium sp. 428]